MYIYILHTSTVSPSITDVEIELNTPNQYRDTHSITVTCVVYLQTKADLCEVTLITANDLTKNGMYIYHIILCVHISINVHIHLCTYIRNFF